MDTFSETVQLTINGGEAEHKTKVGALFSLVMMCSVLAFGTSRFVKLIKRDDTEIQVTEFVDFFKQDYHFEGTNRFKLAFSIRDGDGNQFDYSDFFEL